MSAPMALVTDLLRHLLSQSLVLQVLLILIVGAVFLFLLVLTMLTLCIIYQRSKVSHLPRPKDMSFFWGHLQAAHRAIASGGHISEQFQLWVKECGPVYVFFAVHQNLVVIVEPSAVKEVLLNPIHTKDTYLYHKFHSLFGQRFIGYSLFNEFNHQRWLQRRKLYNPAFKKGYLTGLMAQYNASSDELHTLLRPSADGKTEIRMLDYLNKTALDVIAKVAFNLEGLHILSHSLSPFSEAATACLIAAQHKFNYPILCEVDPHKMHSDIRKRGRDACLLLRGTAQRTIEERFEALKSGEDVPADILTYMLKAVNDMKEAQEFGMEEMIDDFVTFFIAGQETTANLMAFTLELIGRNPDVYQKLQVEIDEVIGDKTFLSFEDISKLNYMSLVLKEVLRLCPPVPGFQRNLGSDVVVNGYKVPKGTDVALNHFTMCRSELYFDDPEEFIPERFEKEDSRRLYAYFPFALGARSCIGQQFSQIEARVILARSLHTFKFELVPGYPLEILNDISSSPKHKTRCFLRLRK